MHLQEYEVARLKTAGVAPAAPAAPAAAALAARERPPCLMVVDDEPALSSALGRVLRERGYEVELFTSAQAALAALRGPRFDVILADLAMPGTDGMSLLRQALQDDPTRVGILMAGKSNITHGDMARTGVLDCIHKPFDPAALDMVLWRAIEVRRLRVANAQLEVQLAQRTAQLGVAHEEMRSFAHSVAHDLRSPVAAIEGLCAVIHQHYAEKLCNKGKYFVDLMRQSARQTCQLIEDMLRLASLSRQPLTRRSLDLHELVGECLQAFRSDMEDRNIDVTLQALPSLHVDGPLVRELFAQLLSNAFKFTRRQPHVAIEVGSRVLDGEPVLYVKDNGAGFNMDFQHQLFSLFQRLHRQEEFEGHGIGLAIAQNIVRRHGGRIWAEAKVGQGATFWLTLPRELPELETPMLPRAPALPPG
jgi:two-component system sensor histidine kinase/response regulator